LFNRLFRRKPAEPVVVASGITVCLLQDRLDVFSTEQLNTYMHAAWHRPYDPTTFWAPSLREDGATLKVNGAWYPIIHKNHRLTQDELGAYEIPAWADHRAFSQIAAKFPGGIPEESLPLFYGVLGLIVAQMISSTTRALFFQEAGVFVRATPELIQELKTARGFLPAELINAQG
jgi:hypothetical protein